MNISRTTVINIETQFILEEHEIAAGTRPIKCIKLENGSIDTLELAKYEDFVSNVFGFVGSHNFKDVDYEYSPHKKPCQGNGSQKRHSNKTGGGNQLCRCGSF